MLEVYIIDRLRRPGSQARLPAPRPTILVPVPSRPPGPGAGQGPPASPPEAQPRGVLIVEVLGR